MERKDNQMREAKGKRSDDWKRASERKGKEREGPRR